MIGSGYEVMIAQKMTLSIKDFFGKYDQIRSSNPQFPADLVTCTKEIFKGKLNFLCSELLNPVKHLKLSFSQKAQSQSSIAGSKLTIETLEQV